MTLYLLSIYQPDGEIPPPDVLKPVMAEIEAIKGELRAAGYWVFGGGLHQPDTATVVRYQNDELVVTDGPYVEGKEHIGGFSVINVPDLDVALAYARRIAKITTLPIEVRPFQSEH
jgi:hypothetical protein